jgi:hypothetical protein
MVKATRTPLRHTSVYVQGMHWGMCQAESEASAEPSGLPSDGIAEWLARGSAGGRAYGVFSKGPRIA